MKAGYISRGRRYTFTLIVLTFTIILLWLCNKNPMLNSSLSFQDELIIFSSDVMIDDDPLESIELEEDQNIKVHSQLEDSGSRDKIPDQYYMMGQTDITQTLLSAKNVSMHLNNKVCNYGKGRWVPDSRRPLYSGFGCKQWLSAAWSCRLTQRSDFSYEGYRWQPENCNLPEFEGSDFLKRMQDKTLAFVGDSLGRQQFQSLMCMITGGEERQDIEDVGYKYDLHGSLRPDGWAYRFPETNTTILFYWSSTLCGIEPLINTANLSTGFAMHLDRPPAFLTRFISQIDVLVLNTGHHWNRGKINANKWIMYVNGEPVKNRKLAEIGNAKNLTIYSIARWVDSQLDIYPGLKVFFRTISPRHFYNGEWNTGGSCDKTTPMEGGSDVNQDESSDLVVGGAVKGMRVKMLDITALSQLRDEGHMSRYSINAAIGVHDCLHWCLPGIPDTWNEILCAQV